MYAYSLLKRSPDSVPPEAVSSLEAAIRLDPANGLAYFRLGTIYVRRGDYKRAETLLRTAVRLDPELKEAQFQYATTLQKLGQSELARVHFEQFRALNGKRAAEDGLMMEELRRVSSN
jgi:Flp pilus assembly protein TadD